MADQDDEKFESTTLTDVFTTGKLGLFDNSLSKAPPCLVLISGPENYIGRQWSITQQQMVIGRGRQSDIYLDVASVSKSHARLECGFQKITIMDLGSTNHTAVNGVTLQPLTEYLLKDNDQIRAGGLVFKFLQKGMLGETKEKSRMQSELEVARNVQASLFPKLQEVTYESVKIGGRYRTATECGGDWWWHWSKGGKAFALIADATGHGAGAALVTSAARSAVATMEDDESVDIGKVYSQLSNALFRTAGGALTMSAFLLEIDLQTLKLRFINASHPNAVWLSLDGKPVTWNSLKFLRGEVSAVLGSNDRTYNVIEAVAQPGQRLVLPTDGLMERQMSDGQPITERQFYTSLIAAHEEKGSDQAGFLDALIRKSDGLVSTMAQSDDITVVAIDFL